MVSCFIVFHIMGNEAPSETELLREIPKRLQRTLPERWKVLPREIRKGRDHGIDARLELRPPGRKQGLHLGIVVQRRLEARKARLLVEEIRDEWAESGWTLLVATPFLSPRTRETLRKLGVSFLDSTGNLELRIDEPVVMIRLEGARKDPWPERRRLRSLKGPASARVVRALVDLPPPFQQREIGELSGASAPTVSRVVRILHLEAFLQMDDGGRIEWVDWKEILGRWTEDYDVLKTHRVRSFLEPRGLDALLRKLREREVPHAVTGILAARRWGNFGQARNAMAYVDAPSHAAELLGLKEVEAGSNVILMEPFDSVVFQRAAEEDGITYCAASQVAADLMTGPGRGPSMAELMLRWMEGNEDVWRTRR